MDTIQKIQDKDGKYDFNFKYSPKEGITEIFNRYTGYVALSTEFGGGSDPEVCSVEFSDLTPSERKYLAKALIDLTYLYRYGGNVDGQIKMSDIVNQLKKH